MSKWTHIVGAVYIDTFRELPREMLKEHIEGELVKAPQVTGLEENAQFFVNILNGYNTYINEPELNIEQGYQTDAVITIVGDLRDREMRETLVETKAFLEYLRKTFHIMFYSITIEDDNGYETKV